MRYLLLIMAWLAGACVAHAQTLPAAGDGHDLWIVRPTGEPDTFVILHRDVNDPPDLLRQALDARKGKLLQVAAGNGRLWLVYHDMTVQSVRVVEPAIPGSAAGLRFGEARVEPALPGGSAVRSLAAGSGGVWALLRIEDQATLDAIDNLPPPRQTDSSAMHAWQVMSGVAESTTQPTSASTTRPAQPADDQPATQAVEADEAGDAAGKSVVPLAAVRADRLLLLDRDRWVSLPLPAEWPVDAKQVWVLPPGMSTTERWPWLAVLSGSAGTQRLLVMTHEGKEWARREHALPAAKDAEDIAVQVVAGQMVVGRSSRANDELSVSFTVLRPTAALPLGFVSLPGPAGKAWAVVPVGDAAALVALDSENHFRWTALDLRGQVTPRYVLDVESPQSFQGMAQYVITIGVLVIATLVLVLFWRRDPNWSRLTLPKNLQLAELPRRASAAALDLVPPVVITLFAFGLSPAELLHRWPGRAVAEWDAMLPGAVCIGLFVLHTGLTELFTGKSLGKALFNLHVTTLAGKPPNVWQILVRNLLKGLDLIPPTILLMLPIVGPHRQRLGDMVGRTVVVMPVDPSRPRDGDGNNDG